MTLCKESIIIRLSDDAKRAGFLEIDGQFICLTGVTTLHIFLELGTPSKGGIKVEEGAVTDERLDAEKENAQGRRRSHGRQ